MTVAEYIEELKKLPQDMPVCGESETGTWDISPDEIKPSTEVHVCRAGSAPCETYPRALIVGYCHGFREGEKEEE